MSGHTVLIPAAVLIAFARCSGSVDTTGDDATSDAAADETGCAVEGPGPFIGPSCYDDVCPPGCPWCD